MPLQPTALHRRTGLCQDVARRRQENAWWNNAASGKDKQIEEVSKPEDSSTALIRNEPPAPRSVRAGDFGGSLERIARSELGSGASQREINNYVGQLFEINGISNARRIGADQGITLPGADTPNATSGLSQYGKDIVTGERIKEQARAEAEFKRQQAAQQAQASTSQGMSSDEAYAIYMAGGGRSGSYARALGSGYVPTFNAGASYGGYAEGTSSGSSVLGAIAGVGASFGDMALGAARVGSNMIMQVGDVLTGGINHDHPMMQRVWAEQGALGQGIVNAVTSPRLTTTNLIEGVANRYDNAMSQSNDFDRSYELGKLFNDVGQGVVGAGAAVRGTARLGVSGLEFVGENAFTGPMSGSRQAQLGAINLASPRYQSGVVSFGDDLVPASGKWLDASNPTPIPLQVARQLEGQSFKTFSDLQGKVWQTIANDAELNAGFGQQAMGQMLVGNAPFAPRALQNSQFGGRFNLHHDVPIGQGGAVYDLSNLRIVSPRVHSNIHYPK